MRRVLIIHYHFLPAHNVAVKRLVAYARQLPAWGWEPVVLTKERSGIADEDPEWGLGWEPDLAARFPFPIHRVPAPPGPRMRLPRARDPWPVRKALSLANLLLGNYPDTLVAWAAPAVEAAVDVARGVPIDAIVTYCPPETNHVVGSRLARRLGLPWVPFFGDLWDFFLAPLPAISIEGVIRKAWHRWWLAPAAACAAPSPYMVEYLARTYRKPAELILTGFDPCEFARPAEAPVRAALPRGYAEAANGPGDGAEDGRLDGPARAPRRDRLVVSHVGSLYPGDQQPEIFFEGLDRFLGAHPEAAPHLQIRFVGSKCDAYLRALVAARPCARVCAILPRVDAAAAVALVRDSDALLLFTCRRFRDRHGTMSYPTKLFEGLGARRPMLAIPPDGDWVDTLLARTGAGTSARDADEVAAILHEWLVSWRRDGAVPYRGRSDAIATFALPRQVERLARLLDSVVAGAPRAAGPHAR